MKATIVNTLPFAIATDRKPGLIPGSFQIPAAVKGGYSLTVIPDCVEVQSIPLREQALRTTLSGEVVAEAVVADYIVSCMGASNTPNFDGSLALPGIFWLPGEVTAVALEKEHKARLITALNNTKAWFQRLIVLADDEWSKNHQRKFILDLQRVACNYLNLSREWNADTLIVNSSNCPSCGTSVGAVVVCPTCKFILDMDKFATMKGQFA